jgi:hypothetical protein
MGITQISDAKTWEVDVINSDIPVFVVLFGQNGVVHVEWWAQ